MTLESIMDPQAQFYVKRDERVKEGPVKLRILTQPADVQVKRVGRASCLEPELKLSIESDTPSPTTITLNAYLRVLGSDNKHKHILLKKSDPIMLSKVHRKELLGMKLRFLKTIKVQVLKRNLGVSRPEASVVFEAVDDYNNVVATASTTHFAIISDPRYLDEVKKRRASDRTEEGYQSPDSSDEQYNPAKRATKRRKLTREPAVISNRDDVYPFTPTNINSISHYNGNRTMLALSNGLSAPMPSHMNTPLHCGSINYITNPMMSDTVASLNALKACADYELSFANSQEEEDTLALLVDSLKYKGREFVPQATEEAH